jgi:hypothetical protein
MSRSSVVALLMVAVVGSSAAAQFPPERTKNLKVFSSNVPVRALLDTMGLFTRALGVRCVYCHAGTEGQPLNQIDFASDENATKNKAREMLKMVAAINNQHLANVSPRREPRIDVTCATCHRGVTEPRTIQQVILTAYDAAGADSAEAVYRSLRQRYYGRAAYDFGEVALADVAMAIRARGKGPDALRFFVLNTQMVPESGFAHRMAGDAQLAAGDTTKAIAAYEKALSINANDPQAKRALDRLKPKQ